MYVCAFFCVHSDYDSNMGSLESLVLVKANSDRMVIPNDSEWFGYFQDGSDSSKWTMEDAPW